MAEAILLLLIVAGWLYWLVAWWLTRAFFKAQTAQSESFLPPVSVLKPLKGLEAHAYENFAAFCRQDYPCYELLFGVAEADDPVVRVVKRIQQDFPQLPIHLVVASAAYANRKASILDALAAHASHEILVASDSDMRVTPEYLRRVVAPLALDQVGLVTCPYRGTQLSTFTARLEALYMGVTFLPSVMVARLLLGMRFALGATMALRARDLAGIGGFAAVADYLADDYQLGVRIAACGLRVRLSSFVVQSALGPTTFREQWQREVRWAHCNRVSRPWGFLGLLLSFSTSLSALLVVAGRMGGAAWLILGASILLRWLVAWSITGYSGDREARHWLFWLPLRDMLSALVWLAGLVGRRQVAWRGETYRLDKEGRLLPLPLSRVGESASVLRWSVRRLDALLRGIYGIYEFNQEPECLLRISIGSSPRELRLADGTPIHSGDALAELHFWNEHLPTMPSGGPDLSWALNFRRRATRSLHWLAEEMQRDPQLAQVKAVAGENWFVAWYPDERAETMAAHWGFEQVEGEHDQGKWGRFRAFWQRFYARALAWAYNPVSVQRHKQEQMARSELWMTREKLLERYLATGGEPGASATHG